MVIREQQDSAPAPAAQPADRVVERTRDRWWEVRDPNGELVAVYKRCAVQVVRRLPARAMQPRSRQPQQSPPRHRPRPAHVLGGTGSSGGTNMARKVVSRGVSDPSPCASIFSTMRMISSRFTSCTLVRSMAL